MKTLIFAALFLSASAFAEDGSYGLQRGSVGVFAGGGAQISAGAHPAINGGVDIGLAKYIGLYANATGVLAYSANVGEFFGGGGVMVSGNNRSRIVPFARAGMEYGRVEVFHWGGANVPVARYGGGFDAYVTKHFGIETQVGGLRTLGHLGGDNAGFVTFGAFYRSR